MGPLRRRRWWRQVRGLRGEAPGRQVWVLWVARRRRRLRVRQRGGVCWQGGHQAVPHLQKKHISKRSVSTAHPSKTSTAIPRNCPEDSVALWFSVWRHRQWWRSGFPRRPPGSKCYQSCLFEVWWSWFDIQWGELRLVLTDKQMTRIKTGGDSFTSDSVPGNLRWRRSSFFLWNRFANALLGTTVR